MIVVDQKYKALKIKINKHMFPNNEMASAVSDGYINRRASKLISRLNNPNKGIIEESAKGNSCEGGLKNLYGNHEDSLNIEDISDI